MEKEVLNNYVQIVKNCTAANDHSGAIKYIAIYVAVKHKNLDGITKVKQAADAVIVLHGFYGEMQPELASIRNDVKARIFSFLDDEETRAFNEAL